MLLSKQLNKVACKPMQAVYLAMGVVVASTSACAIDDRYYDRDERAYQRDEHHHHHRDEQTYGRIALQSLESVAGFRFANGPIRITVVYPRTDERGERPQSDSCVMRAPTACETSHQPFTPRSEEVRVSVTQGERTRHAAYRLDYRPETGRNDIVIER